MNDCPIKKLPEVSELLKFARDQSDMTRNIKEGVNKLLESQIHVVGLLDELKPLRSLPDISNNLSKLVEKLIEPATKQRRDWASLSLVLILAVMLILIVFKEYSPEASIKLFGSEASIHTEKKT